MSRTPAEAEADLKAVIREANETIKGLRETIRDAKNVEKAIQTVVTEMLDGGIGAIVKAGLDAYTESLDKAVKDAQEHILDQFDNLYRNLMGTTKQNLRKGEPTVPDMLSAYVDHMRDPLAAELRKGE